MSWTFFRRNSPFVNNFSIFNLPKKHPFPLFREAIENEREIFFNIALVSKKRILPLPSLKKEGELIFIVKT